jgi:hypothetical protein
MQKPEEQSPSTQPTPPNAVFHEEVERLYRLIVYSRWLFVSLLWLTVGSSSLWRLRYPISLILEHFTWAAVRYGLIFDLVPAFGLFLCVGSTLGVLLWQSRNSLVGLPQHDRKRLEQQVLHIRQQGPSHPLWKLVCQN